MTPEEAIQRCAFWTTLGQQVIGSTRDPEVAAFFAVPEKDSTAAQAFTDPRGPRVYAITIPSRSPYHPRILEEIERRAQNG